MREIVVPRVFGSEVEYTYSASDGGVVIKNPVHERGIGTFIENGARVYADAGPLPEFATGECQTIAELITHEIAGERIVADTWQDARITGFHKRTLSPTAEKSTGAHENYLTVANHYGDSDSPTVNALMTHFATRSILTGAGYFSLGQERFCVAQKVHDLTEEHGAGNTSSKALVNTRDEAHISGFFVSQGEKFRLRRLHVVCGDANVSPLALRLKFGTTSLLLRMIENGIPLGDLSLEYPLYAAQFVGGEPRHITQKLELRQGKRLSALEVQTELAERALGMAGKLKLPSEEVEIAQEWATALGGLKRYLTDGSISDEVAQLDWVRKRELIGRFSSKHSTVDSNQLAALDLSYDTVPEGIGTKLRRHDAHMPSEHSITEAITIPPLGRAQRRGALIVTAIERKRKHIDVDWAGIAIQSTGSSYSFGSTDRAYTPSDAKKWAEALPIW